MLSCFAMVAVEADALVDKPGESCLVTIWVLFNAFMLSSIKVNALGASMDIDAVDQTAFTCV